MALKRKLRPENAKLLDDFRKDCNLRKITTVRRYIGDTARFIAWAEARDLDPLKTTRKDLKDYTYYLTELGVIFSTLKLNFIRINAFFDYLEAEELIESNPVPAFRRRHIRAYKSEAESQRRQIIDIEQAAKLVGAILGSRDRAIMLLLLKCGLRCHELCELNVEDIDLEKLTLRVHPSPKRSNRELFFDYETAEALRMWLNVRPLRRGAEGEELFISIKGNRVSTKSVQVICRRAAARVGLHDSKSKRLDKKFTPHCCRHWFTTRLIEAGMPRDYVKELRGDARREAIDIYNHIDKKMLKESYLACIPQLGV